MGQNHEKSLIAWDVTGQDDRAYMHFSSGTPKSDPQGEAISAVASVGQAAVPVDPELDVSQLGEPTDRSFSLYRGLFSSPKVPECTLLGLQLTGDLWFFFPPFFSFLECEYQSCTCLTTVFWKQRTHVTASQLERNFCLGMNHISSLTHAWFRWYLVENWDLKLMLERSKSFGLLGSRYMYFTCNKNATDWTVSCPPSYSEALSLRTIQYDYIWTWDLTEKCGLS